MGRGRDSGSAQQQGPYPQQQGQYPQQGPYPAHAQPPYGGQQPYPAPYGQQPAAPSAQQWQQYGGGGGRSGEPEYLGGPHYGGQAPYHDGADSYDDNPGHTRAFSVDELNQGYGPGSEQDGQPAYHGGSTYRAGQSGTAPVAPRLHWKRLLSGIVLRPGPTFMVMRDHTMWGAALTVTFLYGLVAVFGFDEAREDVLNATLGNSVPWVISTGIAVVISGLILGAVTHTLARQLGGDGAWQPTVGLSMLIMSLTDAPRLLFAVFLGGDSTLVQTLGWVTWIAAGTLFTSMVGKSHDLPWARALSASSIQLVALLALIKLGTL